MNTIKNDSLNRITDFQDALNIKSVQLVALVNLITGEGFEHFATFNEAMQHHALSLVADLAYQINDANHSINEIRHSRLKIA
jgi:hypothetical protein